MSLPVWLPGPMFFLSGSLSRRVSVQGGALSRGSLSGGLFRETPGIRKAGGCASSGMLSCFYFCKGLRCQH